MKLRTTTPVRLSEIATLLVAMAFVVLAGYFAITHFTKPASADQYDDRIAELQADMEKYQDAVDELNDQAVSLQNTLAQLANQKAALQTQIDLSQAEYDKLVVEIRQTEEKIKEGQDALGETIADLYVDDDVSTIELLASSDGITDYLDRQEYRSSIRDELSSTIKEVKELKVTLDQKKVEVEEVLAEQKAARDELVATESQQQTLLAQTQSDEAAYQELIADSEEQIASARAAQAALRARTEATGGYTLVAAGSLGDYPWNSSNCPMYGYMSLGGANGNGGDGYGYGCRQCVSYVAWRIAKETGVYYTDLGNGGSAGYNLANKGYQDLGGTPMPGSIAVLWGTTYPPYSNFANPGHVAWVEGVSPDGQYVTVSQYNYNYGSGWGMYSEMVLSTSFFDQYVKVL